MKPMKRIFKNIRQLVGVWEENPVLLSGEQMNNLPVLENAWIGTENGVITGYGTMDSFPGETSYDEVIDASGRLVLPAFTDSHTHTVFPESRYGEFIDKIKGLSYEEIAAKGGGILNSARKLAQKPEEELYQQAFYFVQRMMEHGTGAVEIKSGYGLNTENELKILRVIKRLKENLPIPVKATFLGAHAVPEGIKKEDYVKTIIEEMLPEIAKENLADYVDVFCETGYFDAHDTEIILEAASKYGLKPKIHVNQFTSIGGIEVAVKHNSLSVDHLEVMTEKDIQVLAQSNAIAVSLPGCSFFIHIPYTPLQQLIKHKIPFALATDFNPGSSPSYSMPMMISLACIKQRITPEQAINASTLNAAAALELSGEMGSITRGKKARLILTKPLNHYGEIPYYFGTQIVERIFV